MATLDELASNWRNAESDNASQPMDKTSLQKIFRSRVKKHLREPFKYFWASLGLQILLYSMLSHVIVKNWGNSAVMSYSVACILLYIPFTIMLLRKFKQMARSASNDYEMSPLFGSVLNKYNQLQS